ncbi:MAG: hypothetical protein IJD01_03165 [Clostridia bacterium]|nr:hypothetical protein [Clostridia bacterium]
MTALFHRGMYGETLRRLRTPALFMLVLATVFDAFPLVMRVSRLSNVAYLSGTVHFDAVHFSLYTIPFIVVPILMLVTFRYQHRRAPSDLYFSFPLSKAALTVSQLCAVLTWTAIIVLGSSLVIACLCLLPVNHTVCGLRVGEVLLSVGGSLTASLFMAAVFNLAVSLCGTTVNTLFAASLILFAPRLVCYALNSLVLECCPMLPPQSTTVALDALMGNLLYGGYGSLTVWLSTLVKIVLLLALSVWAATRRPTEIAGQAAVHPALHIAFRTAVGMLLSLPAVGQIVTFEAFSFGMTSEALSFGMTSSLNLMTVTFYYLNALVGYYVYELITTRKAMGLVKATLWLPLLILVNVLMIGGCLLTEQVICHTTCDPASVSRVELRAVTYRTEVSTMDGEYGYEAFEETWFDGLTVMDEYGIKSPFFYRSRQYAQSQAPHTPLTGKESRELVCKALSRTLEYHDSVASVYDVYRLAYLTEEAKADGSAYVYSIDVVIHDGWIARSRRIGVTAKELTVLLGELKEAGTLPDHFINAVR